MNVINLGGKQAGIAAQPNAAVIEALEDLLEHAKAGRIQHLAAVFTDGVQPPSDLYVGSGEPEQVMMIVGAMELCKHTMLMSQYESSAGYTTTK